MHAYLAAVVLTCVHRSRQMDQKGRSRLARVFQRQGSAMAADQFGRYYEAEASPALANIALKRLKQFLLCLEGQAGAGVGDANLPGITNICLLYTSDAADE